jgi:hypothetical protein
MHTLERVRVIQRGKNLGFAAETRESLRVVGERVGQDLQGDVATELCVAGAIDLAHAARPERRDDFVRARRVSADVDMGATLILAVDPRGQRRKGSLRNFVMYSRR